MQQSGDVPDLKGRLALVTGASRGLGFAAALGLARAGAHIIALARTSGGLEELDDMIHSETGTGATLVPMDVRDGEAIDRLGLTIHERWGKLDILVGNAGTLGPLSPLGHLAPKDVDELVGVNLIANWRLIRSCDPLLKAAPAGRAVFITADQAQRHDPFWGGYAMTKAALDSLALTYAAECAGTSVSVSLFDPGIMRTALRARAMPGEDAQTLPLPESAVERLLTLCA